MVNPISPEHCPLCQQPNKCAITQADGNASQCWCMRVKIAPETLAQLSLAQQNISCVCSQCALLNHHKAAIDPMI